MEIPREWTFKNKNIADSFDQHVREQLPFYDMVTGAISHIARHYIGENGLVYDIGASTGNIGRAVEDIIKKRNAKIIPIENAKEMCDLYTGPQKENLILENALDVEYEKFDLAICFLVIMFFPVEKREIFIKKLLKKTKIGGAIIIFDKVTTNCGYIATILMRLALAGKLAANVTADEIIAKELSLSGVQRPLDPKILPNPVEWFKFGDFTGWIIENNG